MGLGFFEEMFDASGKITDKLSKTIRDGITRYQNDEFLDAVLAGCALVMVSNGDVKSEEKNKMIGFIQGCDELNVFDMEDVIKRFGKCVDKIKFDIDVGQGLLIKEINKIEKDPAEGRLMIQVLIAIAKADKDFDENEKAMVAKIAKSLNLDPAEFGLPVNSTVSAVSVGDSKNIDF